MAKKTTLKEIGAMLSHVVQHMATKEELAEMRQEMATRQQLASVQTQVNSIEQQLRQTKVEIRLADLEDKVFGKVRG